MEDVNTIRETNNAIFNDIFWVHLAYGTAEDGIECLRALLGAERHYAPVLVRLRGDRPRTPRPGGRTASAEARRAADDLIWEGNVQLLEHEQRALVQPNFDRLSCAFARLFSIGSALTFEVRGMRQEVSYFTSFYLYSLTRGIPQALHAQAWPRITRFDDRWRWIVTSIVPRFRRFDADMHLADASLRRIFDEARDYATNPCHPTALFTDRSARVHKQFHGNVPHVAHHEQGLCTQPGLIGVNALPAPRSSVLLERRPEQHVPQEVEQEQPPPRISPGELSLPCRARPLSPRS